MGSGRSLITAELPIPRPSESGLVAWLLWGLVPVYFLIGNRNRLVVLMSWLWAYVSFERGARLITGHET